ncbi:unnamed protein product [Didymodactylos carnosus]|uniref:Uncharacterized protein n=1 Tax=Didymodactylos carnosus TaxID=1234261 RepID=A0A8S2EMA2_9BILA|nr:unnamed protein product [Didymodactylos carnosus]CAF3995946.1 unnamed protein product [Didymodactylos carnosus]
MTMEQVNRLELTDSTALQVASYYDHQEIVQLLVEFDASRSIINKYKCIPYDEASNLETQQLFHLSFNNNRFVGTASGNGQIEWIVNGRTVKICQAARALVNSVRYSIDRHIHWIRKSYTDKYFNHIDNIDVILHFFLNVLRKKIIQFI